MSTSHLPSPAPLAASAIDAKPDPSSGMNIATGPQANAVNPMPEASSDKPAVPELWQVMEQRYSTRAFLPDAVPAPLLAQLLQLARRAPSGGNLQPGCFTEVRGQARERLSTALLQDLEQQAPEREDYRYFPQPMPMQLRKRQVASAQALYSALGVAREDRAGRSAQFARNYRFFDAPVALVISIDSRLGTGCYMDLGMALYGLQLAASAIGLGSCAIGALASYPDTVRRALGLPPEEHIVCGLALGWPDPLAPVNQTRTARAPLSEYHRVLE